MKQYFTALESTSEGFVGTIFDPNTNISIYKTQPYANQVDANQDIAEYLKTTSQPLHLTQQQPSVSNPTVLTPKRKCCGRQ
jgi:hypothetical protein